MMNFFYVIFYADLHRKDYLDDVDGVQGREYVKQKSKNNSKISNEIRGSVSIDLRKEKKLDDALACMKIEKEAGSLRKPLGREISGPISGTIPKYVVKNSKNKKVAEKEEKNNENSKDLEIIDSNNNEHARSRTKSSSSSIPSPNNTNTNNTTTISSSNNNNNKSTVPLTLSVKDLMNR